MKDVAVKYRSASFWLARFLLILLLGFTVPPADAAVKITSIVCAKSTVSKGQTGIIVEMEVENLDVGNPTTATNVTLTYSLGQYETTLNFPTLPAIIPAAGKATFNFTLSVFPLSDSGVCTVDGEVYTTGGNDLSADLNHKWTVQQPAEVVITSIIGPDEVTRGSFGNQAIMDVSRNGEADIIIDAADLAPVNPSNYASWVKVSPEFPQNFSKTYWWDKNWLFRKQMKITNRSSSVLPATYEIKFVFDHQQLVNEGKSLANGDDIRVVYFDGVTFSQIERYLDPLVSGWNQNDTTIWFRLQNSILAAPASADRYALYYGTDPVTAASPPDSPANIFVFFDDFESGLNGWSQGRFPTYIWAYGDRWELGTATNGDGDADNDGRGPLGPRSGGNYWATDLDNTYDNSGRATCEIISLRTPDIDLSGKLNPTFSFWDFYDNEDGGAYDFGILRVCQGPVPAQSDPMQPNGTQLQLLESAYMNQHGPWQQQFYSLSPSVGKTVYVEFTFGSDWASNAYGWAIDDALIRQVAVPEPDNPLLGLEEQVPVTPTIKIYFNVDVADNAVPGDDIIDGIASGTEGNTEQIISDDHATLPLEWFIRGQNFKIYSNTFYSSPKNTFNIGETIYCKGTGYTPNVPCLVKWLDPSLNTILSATIYPDSLGNIYCSRIMQVTDTTGLWKIKITNISESVVFAETSFNLNSPAQLVSQIILPDQVVIGQEFQIVHKVSNAGQTSAIGVGSSALASWGGGSVLSISGPVPNSLSIPGGSSAEFVWTAVAGSQGQLNYRGNCNGTVEGTANTTSSLAVTSNVCAILQEGYSVKTVDADDLIVTKGQTGVTQRVTFENTGTADLNVTAVDLLYHQGATDESDKYTFSIVQPTLPAKLSGNPFPAWWNTNYAYRQRLRIKGNNQNYPAGCSARITIDTSQYVSSSKMQADADDWRVVFWDDVAGTWTELNREYVSSEVTWFKLQRDIPTYGNDEGYFIYYGNSAAINPPASLNDVYLFYEDWEAPVRGNGFIRCNANADINGDGEWRVGTDNQDGIYIARNQWDGGNPLFRNAQALCLRRLDFGNVNDFAEVIRNLNTQAYPAIKLSWWRYYDDNCDWDNGTRYDWARVVYWDGAAEQTVINYPGNGPDDSIWHYEEYDLSGFSTSPSARLHFRGNFWWGGADWRDRIIFDDIKAMMAAPDCMGLGEETQLPTELIATFTVGVLPTAPTGLYTLNASATFQSIIATGTYTDTDSTTTDTWTVANQTIETFSDPAMTVNEEKFPVNSNVYAKFSGFTPGAVTVRWYDGYPTGSLIFTDNPFADGSGYFPLNNLIPGAAKYGMWTIAVTQGVQVATGSFRVMALPETGSKFHLDPTQTTVGVKFLATLDVLSCVSASDFNLDAVGAVPTSWAVNQPARILVVNDALYADDPLTNYLGMVSNAATTLTAEKAFRLKDCSSISVNFDYSLVLVDACNFFVEYSINGGGNWTTLVTRTLANGAGNWVNETLDFPDAVGNTQDFRLRFRFVTTGAGTNRAYVDNVFVSAQSPNFEDVDFQPKTWIKDPSGTGDASIVGSPLPASQLISVGQTAQFTAQYMPINQTNINTKFYLHGPGAPAYLASGLSTKSSTPIHAAISKSSGIEIFLEALSVTPAVVDMGTVEPGSQSGLQTLKVSNDGNIDLERVCWEFYNLASDPYFIPNSAISVAPEKIGLIAVGGNSMADIRVSVPAGTVAGIYKANQFVFEDNDQDGNSMEEPVGQFELKITVPAVEKLRAATDSLFLGSFLAGETTATATVLVTNVGNINLNIVRFVPVNLISGANIISSSSFNLNPQARGFLVKGSSYFQNLSLSIAGSTPTGIYSGTCFFLDDKNANLLYEVGEASYPIKISVEVGSSENFSLSDGTVTLPNTAPGEIAASGNLTLTNTGNISLNYLRYEVATLTVSGEEIGTEYISFSPDPFDPVNVGNNSIFQTFVVMPPGQPNPGGRYVGDQRIYNDKNQNGIWDAGEVNHTFLLRIRPGGNIRNFVISQDVANLGAGLPSDLVSGNIEVMNIGNDTSNRLKWFVTSNLVSGANTIPAGVINYIPADGWVLSNVVGASQIATISFTIPVGQAAGTYLGECVLYRDGNNNNVYGDDADASDTFLIQVEVGSKGVNVVESSPFILGVVNPGESTSVRIFSVENTGERTLTNLKYVKPDLTSGFLPPIPAGNQIYSTPDPIGLIAGGVTTGPSVYVNIPYNCSPAVYFGQLRVYQDEDDDEIWDGAAEVWDTLDYQLQVLPKVVLGIEPAILDLGGADKGQTVQMSFTGTNIGNINLSKITYAISNMVDGENIIPESSITLTIPENPWAIPYSGITTEIATITVKTFFSTPTSNYTGFIIFWEDSDSNGVLGDDEASDVMQVKLAVGKKDLAVLEDELNYGVVQKGTNSSNIKFTVRNIGTVALYSTKIIKADLLGPGTIPDTDLVFSSAVIAPPKLNPGVAREVGLYIKTDAALPSGVYEGIQTIYEDINGNGIVDVASEPFDTFNVSVTVTSGGVLSYELVANPGALTATIARGKSKELPFKLQSLCTNVMTNVDIQRANLASDATIIPFLPANITFNPPSGIVINPFAQINATVSVNIPTNIPAGHYIGYQHPVDLDHTIASTNILLDITVPKTILNLSPAILDMGILPTDATSLGDFVVQNAGLNDSELFFVFSDFIWTTFTIPGASASVLIPLGTLNAGDSVAASVSLIIASLVPSGNYVGTMTLSDFNFSTESVSEMSITFVVESGIVDSIYQTIDNTIVPNTVIPSEDYIFSAFVCATATVNNLFEGQLTMREWRFDDSVTPLATHTILISGAKLNSSLGKWFRVSMPFTSNNSAALGSFTLEITIRNGDSGDTALFDGIQVEKAFDASGFPDKLPTPWVENKGIVSPMRNNGLLSGEPYYTW